MVKPKAIINASTKDKLKVHVINITIGITSNPITDRITDRPNCSTNDIITLFCFQLNIIVKISQYLSEQILS